MSENLEIRKKSIIFAENLRRAKTESKVDIIDRSEALKRGEEIA